MNEERSAPETFHCPQCGAATPVTGADESARCAACGHEFRPAQVETIPRAAEPSPSLPLPEGEGRGAGARPEAGPEAVPELAPGVELGGYRLEKEIGRGGMGIVYLAVQKSLGRNVAIKVLPRKLAGDPEFVGRFEREALALAALNHPNIVGVIDKGVAGEVCFLVMELVEGVSLRRLLDGGKLPPEQALAIVPQICSALEYAHGKGIVHRDIKPENILVSADGQVKITDFGLARILHGDAAPGAVRLTRTHVLMGTPDYMAPEQRERAGTVDHRADIFSLGVVFYEMLTGELPLGRFPPPSRKVQVNVGLDEVVLKALEKEPGLRYQRASHLSRDASQFAGQAGAGPGASPGAFVQAGPRGVEIRLPGGAADIPAPAAESPGGGRGQSGTAMGGAEARRCGLAVAALVCALVSLCGIVPVLAAMLALVLGLLAQRQIRESQGRLSGRGMALFGVIVGIGVLVLQALALAVVVGGMTAAFGGAATGGGAEDLANAIGLSVSVAPVLVIGGGLLVALVALVIVALARPAAGGSRLSLLALAALLLALAPFLLLAVLLVFGLLWMSADGGRPVKSRVTVTAGPRAIATAGPRPVDDSRVRPDVGGLIRSVQDCSFDSARREILAPLAGRPDLNAEEQKLLVKVTMEELDNDSGRTAVLKALIANPAFGPEGSAAISAEAGKFDFDGPRDEILRLLAGRRFPAEAPPLEAPEKQR